MLTRRRWIAIGLLAVIGSVGYQRHNETEAETDPAQVGFAAAIDKYDLAMMNLGAPLVDQLNAFIAGTRHNDSGAQMRNMVREMTADEIDEVATFYARKASSGEPARAAL